MRSSLHFSFVEIDDFLGFSVYVFLSLYFEYKGLFKGEVMLFIMVIKLFF